MKRNNLDPLRVQRNLTEAICQPGFGGCTFCLDGSEFLPCDTTPGTDVVTVSSRVVETRNADPREIVALVMYELGQLLPQWLVPTLDANHFTFGVFWLDETHTKLSVDVNVLVPDQYRESTLAFAKRNHQQAIWSYRTGEAIPAGGSGRAGGVDVSGWAVVAARLRAGHPVDETFFWKSAA